jgi:hypothetical protein
VRTHIHQQLAKEINMSVTIYQDDGFSGYAGYFPGYGYTPNLSYYAMGYSGESWNDQVSSLYSSTYLYVFEDAGYSGDYALLSPGYHDLANLQAYGIDNDTISSFYAV